MTRAKEIESQIQEFDLSINGDSNKRFYSADSEPSISGRLRNVLFAASNSTHGPTKTHREQYEIARKQLAAMTEKVQGV